MIKYRTFNFSHPFIRLFCWICLIVFCISTIKGGLTNSSNGSVSFVYQRFDYFQDFFNSLNYAKNNDYYAGLKGVYPPALMLCLRVFNYLVAPKSYPGVQLRDSSLLLAILFILATWLSIFLVSLKINKTKYIDDIATAFGTSLILASSPFLLFAIDRLNLILLAFLSQFIMVYCLSRRHSEFKIIMRASLWLSCLIKPYFMIPLLIFECLYAKSVISMLKKTIQSLAIYAFANELPFLLPFKGSIFTWIRNILEFNSTTQGMTDDWLWKFSYYSLSPVGVSKAFPFTSFDIFNIQEFRWIKLTNGFAIAFSILVSGLLIMYFLKLFRLRSNIFFAFHQFSAIRSEAENSLILLVSVIPFLLLLVWINALGYYSAVFVIIPICLGYYFSENSNKYLIIYSLLLISILGSSLGLYYSASALVCAMSWGLTLYCIRIAVEAVEEVLNTEVASQNS